MASYSGTARAQYDGPAIDNLNERALGTPTAPRVALFTDIDRNQWAMMTRWGHPPYCLSVCASDGGYTGSSGSYSAVARTLTLPVLVPPRVAYANIRIATTGAVKVKFTTSHDSNGAELVSVQDGGSASPDEPQLQTSVYTYGPSGTSYTGARSLLVHPNTSTAQSTMVPVTVTITRADLDADNTGNGGVLWDVRFIWVRDAVATYKSGDTADSTTV